MPNRHNVFRDAVVQSHVDSLEGGQGGAHVVEHRGGLEGEVDVHGALVLPGELQQVLPAFAESCDEVGFRLFARRDMDAAAHRGDGVECGTDGRGEGAAVFDDVGVAQAASASEELEA